jgi:MFS transporter, PAT family, beta-lactamase induction signal transducer AmpG
MSWKSPWPAGARLAERVRRADLDRRARLATALTVYLRPRVLVVLLLGFSAGLPLALSGETLRVWLADCGVDLATIGLLTLAGLPYTIKFLWAPVVDALDIPWLSKRFGRRRGWLIATQLVLMGTIVFLGTRAPQGAPLLVGLAALIVAFASATQDVLIDAYRVESLAPEEQAAGMASYVAAYRVGGLVSTAGVIALSAWFEAEGLARTFAWSLAYLAAAGLVLIGVAATLLGADVARPQAPPRQSQGALKRIAETARGAFSDFLSRTDALAILALIILFKLCDALAGTMTGPFVLGLGYDKATYAAVVKGVGLAALLGGGFAGGAIARTTPMSLALWLGASLQMLSNLAFVWLNFQTPGSWALTVVIVIENFTGAMGTVFFVAYLSALCRNPLHTATQYALLTALASTARTLLSAGTGALAALIGWPLFFLATTLAALPALAVLALLQRRGHFAALEAGREAAAADSLSAP